jgi:hypothetical protein
MRCLVKKTNTRYEITACYISLIGGCPGGISSYQASKNSRSNVSMIRGNSLLSSFSSREIRA